MLMKDPETGQTIVELPEVRAARVAEADTARADRAMRSELADKVWGAMGSSAMADRSTTAATEAPQGAVEVAAIPVAAGELVLAGAVQSA